MYKQEKAVKNKDGTIVIYKIYKLRKDRMSLMESYLAL